MASLNGNRKRNNSIEFYDYNHSEIFDEASERIGDLFRAETNRDLECEVVSLIFDEGQLVEIRTDTGETIYEA